LADSLVQLLKLAHVLYPAAAGHASLIVAAWW
jgi:hypothetical protein